MTLIGTHFSLWLVSTLSCIFIHAFTIPPSQNLSRFRYTSSVSSLLPLNSKYVNNCGTSSTFSLRILQNENMDVGMNTNVSNNKKVVRTQVQKKPLPISELIKRRKSPALWREDLTILHTEENFLSTASQDDRRQNHPPEEGTYDDEFFPKVPPEIMSPVGGFPQLYAAIANGADSIYLGLSSYSARARANNFAPGEELQRAVSIAHDSSVKVYVALNTLIFDSEMEEVTKLIQHCSDVGVDAIIVQDFGIAALAKQIAPSLEVHASTQQTVTNMDGVLYAHEYCGATRVVLGRELSVAEIQSVIQDLHSYNKRKYDQRHSSFNQTQNKTEKQQEPVEVEVFVHGALCVSYSGQCFSSEAWGGRSANRGQCAQACRLPYGLIKDGTLVDLKDMNYLLSPQDLCGLEHVDDLVRAGVSCLKIEGRLKDEKYVAATTRAYRDAVDKAWAKLVQERNEKKTERDPKATLLSPSSHSANAQRVFENKESIDKGELALLFSRGQNEDHDGLTPGFFEGTKHQRLVIGRSPRHRGVHIGHVAEGSSWKTGLIITPDDDTRNELEHKPFSVTQLKLGDGIVIDRGMPQEQELGGPIYQLESLGQGRDILIRFGREVEKRWKAEDNGAQKPLAPVGAHVWKTSDADVDRKMKRLAESSPPKNLVEIFVTGRIDEPLTVTIKDLRSGREATASSTGLLVKAENQGLSGAAIRKAVGTLGNTRWAILDGDQGINLSGLSPEAWCPISWVKESRRQALERLEYEQMSSNSVAHDKRLTIDSLRPIRIHKRRKSSNEEIKTRLSVLARSTQQIEALCEMIQDGELIDEIIVDFLEVDGIKDAVSRIRDAEARVVIASPRIIKPGEAGIWRTLLRLEPDGLLVRSAGLLRRLIDLGGTGAVINVGNSHVSIPHLIGDFSLNTVNILTANQLLDIGKLSRITAAYDLSANAITELARVMGPAASKFEVIAHAHLPIFHTEHCVFARFLSHGNSFVDCGHVCQKHTVHLRDQSGSDNLVLADMGCRNTVFSAEAQSGAHSIPEWIDAGVGTLRIELVDEGPDDVARIVKGYSRVMLGLERPSMLWDTLKLVRDSNGRRMDVGPGSLRNRVERRAGEV